MLIDTSCQDVYHAIMKVCFEFEEDSPVCLRLTLIEEDEQEADIDEFESDDSDSETAVTLVCYATRS